MLSDDVLSIVSLYVIPYDLLSFMVKHKIRNLPMKYDASNYNMPIEPINRIFNNIISYNPNFRVTGISIEVITCQYAYDVLTLAAHDIRRIVLGGSLSRTKLLAQINVLSECTHITHLTLQNLNIKKFNMLYKHTNLRVIKFSYCYITEECARILSSCPNLKSIRLVKCCVENNVTLYISCNKLRHFSCECNSTECCNRYFKKFMLKKCVSLHHVKILCRCLWHMFPLTDVAQIGLHNIQSVRSIDLSNCKALTFVNALNGHPNLRYLNLSNCRLVRGVLNEKLKIKS